MIIKPHKFYKFYSPILILTALMPLVTQAQTTTTTTTEEMAALENMLYIYLSGFFNLIISLIMANMVVFYTIIIAITLIIVGIVLHKMHII